MHSLENDQRFFFRPVVGLPDNSGNWIIHNEEYGAVSGLPPSLANLILNSKGWHTVGDVVDRLSKDPAASNDRATLLYLENLKRRLPSKAGGFLAKFLSECFSAFSSSEHESSIRKQLIDLYHEGFIVSESDFIQMLSQVTGESSPQIETLSIITSNRPESLFRCLCSYAENAKRFERNPRFLISDDSITGLAEQQNLQVIETATRRFGIQALYIGPKEKKEYAGLIASEAQVPDHVINFALFDPEGYGAPVGANRNAVLLNTAGELFLCVDDDTVCSTGKVKSGSDSYSFCENGDPREMRFFPEREAALASVIDAEVDILELHESLLGRSVSGVVSEKFPSFDLFSGEISPSTLEDITCSRGKVVITMNGLVGDSGMGLPVGLLWLEGRSRNNLLQSEDAYRSACVSREVRRVSNGTVLSSADFCMTTFWGADNRVLLPPFSPVGRHQDGLFGATLKKCVPYSYSGFLPTTLAHIPPAARRFSSGEIHDYVGQRITHIIWNAIYASMIPGSISTPADRVRMLGNQLMDLASVSDSDFLYILSIQHTHQVSSHLTYLEKLLEDNKRTPRYWADDLYKQMEARKKALLDPISALPRDICGGQPVDHKVKMTKKLFYKFGELLFWWPVIVESAKKVKAEFYSRLRPRLCVT